jgi:Domain of unknown function (DUF4437)
VARPHVEFVHEQVLPWVSGAEVAGRPDSEVRVLSLDPDTGSCSLVVRYPAGWTRDQTEYLTADEELFVLSGSLTVNGVAYDALTYAFLPAGHVRRGASSPDGALVLTFLEGRPRFAAGEPDDPGDHGRLVERIHAFDDEWGGNFHPQFPPGAGRKYLREDPVTGEQTWLLGTMPLRFGLRPEKHPIYEETFLLSGEVVSPIGLMHPGAYFWRPPEVWHGPYGTKTGNLYLFRTKGGPLSTEYGDPVERFDWDPPHEPVLTAELAGVGGMPYHGMPEF